MNIQDCRVPYVVMRPVPFTTEPEIAGIEARRGIFDVGRVIYFPATLDQRSECTGFAIGTGFVHLKAGDGHAIARFKDSGMPELQGGF